MRPYNAAYLPFKWRGWWDFGTGAMGDMGCHIMDYPFWALNLKAPESIEAYSTSVNDISAPHASTIKYQFINGLNQSSVEVIWYDGGMKPFMPKGLTSDAKLWEKGSGVIFEGKDGIIVYGHHRPKPILIVNNREIEYKQPKQKIERSIGHYQEWISEIKGEGKKAMSNFNYAGPLNEAVLLGNVALRSGRRIEWNPDDMKIPNYSEANIYLGDKIRDGWSL
jgi:predicted dehydrogenase